MTRFRAGSALAVLVASVLPLSSLGAQGTEWRLVTSPAADLLAHGLGTIGFEGFGVLPLYERGRGPAVRRERAARGVAPTLLERDASVLLAALRADSAFEVLHFAPVYFASASVGDLLEGLRAAGRGPQAISELRPAARFGAEALGLSLRTDAQRQVLRRLADALEDDWARAYREERRASAASLPPLLARVGARWSDTLAPSLRGYLGRERLAGGLLVVSPVIGADGRLFAGQPGNDADNVVVVRLPREAPEEAALFAARELCYPLVRRLLDGQPAPGSRAEGERMAGALAVRCGERMAARAAGPLGPAAREAFLREAGDPGRDLASFERRFPVSATLAAALDSAIAALP